MTTTETTCIKFRPQFVADILRGRKTQTRRPLRPQPTVPDEFLQIGAWGNSWATTDSRSPDDGVVDEWWSLERNKIYTVHDGIDLTDVRIKISNVSAQRLHEISRADIAAEGADSLMAFIGIWDSIYRVEAEVESSENNVYCWARNPWVFVYEFEIAT